MSSSKGVMIDLIFVLFYRERLGHGDGIVRECPAVAFDYLSIACQCQSPLYYVYFQSWYNNLPVQAFQSRVLDAQQQSDA